METPYPKPITPSTTRIGWIGIGVMGSAMASRLISAGYSLTVYARNPSKALPLQSKGAHLASSPLDLAKSSDVVFTMVGHPSDVRSVVLDPDGVLSWLKPGGVVVDNTSSHPEHARRIFDAARERGCWAVDAPVSGGDIGARDGKLAIFAGGDKGVVEWLKPLFDTMGKVTYMGSAGCGQSCKIANQIVVGANLVGLSEGLVFAERSGLDVRQFVDAIRRGAAGSMVIELFGERMIEYWDLFCLWGLRTERLGLAGLTQVDLGCEMRTWVVVVLGGLSVVVERGLSCSAKVGFLGSERECVSGGGGGFGEEWHEMVKVLEEKG